MPTKYVATQRFYFLKASLSSFHRTSFNRLLVYLAAADLLLIFTFVAEFSVMNALSGEQPVWYRVAFPHLFHPLKGSLGYFFSRNVFFSG